ncbi:histamine H2 receptor-like [Oculina patagonica]
MTTNSSHFLNSSNNEPHDRLRNFFEPDYDGGLIVLCIAVICVNMLVLVLYRKRRQLRTKTNTLLVSLATSDLLMGLCGIPLYIACNAILNENICIAQAVVFRFIAVSTMFHILAITGERYVCVLHPMRYINIVTGKRILRVIACIWTISLFVALIQLSWVLPFGYFSKNATKFTSSLVYNCVGLTICFAIPFFSMVVVYSKMFITIRRQVQKIKRQSVRLDAATSSINIRTSHRQLRALLIFSLMLGLFAGSWVTWYISIFQLYMNVSFFSEVSMVVFDFLRVGVSLINPLLYTFLKNDFREAFMSFVKCKRTNLEVSASQTTGITSQGRQRHSIFNLKERNQMF